MQDGILFLGGHGQSIKTLPLMGKLIMEESSVAFIREQLHAYLQETQVLMQEHAALKDAHTKLQAEHAGPQPPPTPNWGSRPSIKGRTEP
jgi:hypothetical protein